MTVDPLGPNFQARTLSFDGGKVATLVRRRADPATRGAILYVHGFSDYFFQGHVAEHFVARGYDFYAVDLRAYGRSLKDGDRPNFVTDMHTHFEEIDAAVAAIKEDGHEHLVVMGHSTGGLITPLWADQRRGMGIVDALVLNSPWLELAEPAVSRTVGTILLKLLGRLAPNVVLRRGLGGVYGGSVHRDHHGEWEFDVSWKPINGFPVFAGWLRAVRKGHAKVHKGLAVDVPVLVLHSDRSLLHAKEWTPEAMRADTVLDVADMVAYGPKLGPDVTLVEIEGGMHDIFLSAEPVRTKALAEVDGWLDAHARK